MKKIIFVFFILFVFSSSLQAGEIYIWKDKNGVENITTTPPPENAKVRDRMQYQRDTPEAIQRYEAERKVATEKGFKGWQRSQKQNSGTSSSTQTSRDQRADKVKADAAARLKAVRDAGINLPQANIDMLEKAADEKARQVKAGTDTPMTEQEDAAFHAREAAEDAIRRHELQHR
jgi:hypothetical protein